ncbi:ribonuclease P protein component [Nocardioides terrae]|uniref:ribonuclease P protein component n=1 Tax=Nocardioides terrae TaxID=574651 RepID=UPI000AC12784|nr:ribonuclease P protein component [Nocardioides terrae]
MLARAHRLTDGAGFASAVRRGRRAGSRTLVVHLESLEDERPVRVGFVVSKAVGPAVTRNRVKRRLRHLARELLSSTETRLPGSAVLVVRALPASSTADYAELRSDLARCLVRVTS